MAIDCTPYPEHRKFLTTPDADHLAELYLLQSDLNAAHDTLSLYLEKYLFSDDLAGEARIISSSLFRDAILLFCSCFSTKDPKKLVPKDVFGHLDNWEAFIRRVLDTRDAFVAHNFGPHRQHNIVVIALEIGRELVPAGFTQVSLRMAGWTADQTQRLLSFIDVAREHLKRLIEAAEQPILKLLEAISSDELAALVDGELSLPDDSDIRTNRSRFRESGRGQRVPLPQRRWVQTIEGELEPRRSDQSPARPDEEAPPTEPEPKW